MTPANTRHPAETDADYTYLFDSIYIWRKKKKQEEEQETHMDPMIDIRVTRRAIRNHTKDARLHGSIDYCIGLMMMMMMFILSSHGAGGPGHPAPPACGRRRFARSAHSTSPFECRRPVCHRRCRLRPPSPRPRPGPRRCPGQHSLTVAARRELRPPLPRAPRRRSAPAGCRAQCRREPWVERTENVRNQADDGACWNLSAAGRVYTDRERGPRAGVSARLGVVPCHGQVPPRYLYIGPMGWSHGAAVTKQTFVWRVRAFLWIIGGWFGLGGGRVATISGRAAAGWLAPAGQIMHADMRWCAMEVLSTAFFFLR